MFVFRTIDRVLPPPEEVQRRCQRLLGQVPRIGAFEGPFGIAASHLKVSDNPWPCQLGPPTRPHTRPNPRLPPSRAVEAAVRDAAGAGHRVDDSARLIVDQGRTRVIVRQRGRYRGDSSLSDIGDQL
jgi:hypothetical protein